MKRTSGFLLLVGGSGLLLFLTGCQSNDRLSPSPLSGRNTTSPPGEFAGREGQPSPHSEKSSGSGSGAVTGPTGSADYARFIQLPIFMSDYEFIPNEIELWLGQDVILDIFNVGSRKQNFTIGRDTVYEDSIPLGFEVDFFQGGDSYIDATGFIGGGPHDELEGPFEPFLWGYTGGYPGNPQGFMAVLPTGYAQVLVQRQHQWFPDNSLGPHTVGTYTLASIEFRVTREMLGEWTYASFAGEGEFYDKGLRGRLVVRSPFPLP